MHFIACKCSVPFQIPSKAAAHKRIDACNRKKPTMQNMIKDGDLCRTTVQIVQRPSPLVQIQYPLLIFKSFSFLFIALVLVELLSDRIPDQ